MPGLLKPKLKIALVSGWICLFVVMVAWNGPGEITSRPVLAILGCAMIFVALFSFAVLASERFRARVVSSEEAFLRERTMICAALVAAVVMAGACWWKVFR